MSRARSSVCVLVLLVGLVATLAAAEASRAQLPPWQDCTSPCKVSTELVGLEKGQGARLELHNKGDRPATAWLFFVDSQGKAVSERKVAVQPGKTEAVNAYHPGGANRFELRAQFMVEEKGALIIFRPAFRVVEEASGKTVRLIGAEGFKRSNPKAGAR